MTPSKYVIGSRVLYIIKYLFQDRRKANGLLMIELWTDGDFFTKKLVLKGETGAGRLIYTVSCLWEDT